VSRSVGEIIELSEKWAISKDTECWTVYKIGKREGEPSWRSCWYYPSLKMLIEGLLDRGFEIPDELNKLVGSMDYWAERMVKTIDARQP
jgi:hypothetical protein